MSSVSFLSFHQFFFCLFPLRLGSWNWISYCSLKRSCRHSMFYHMKNIVKFILNNQKSLLLKKLFVLCPFPFLIKTEMNAWKCTHNKRSKKRGHTKGSSYGIFTVESIEYGYANVHMFEHKKNERKENIKKSLSLRQIFDSFFVWFFLYFFFFALCVLVIGIVFRTISKLNRQPLNWIRHLIHAHILRHDFPKAEFNIHAWNAMSERM